MQMPFIDERHPPDFSGQSRYQQLHRYGLAFGLARDLDVLDIACGEGYGAAYLALVARSVVGVELDRHTVRDAAARYTGMNLTFRTGSFSSIPAADRSTDLVVSFETFEEVDDREQFMREIVRVLRPGGKLIVSVPNKLFEPERSGADNGFPVRAMFFDEFRDLLRNWFPQCRLHGQRIIAASAIHPLRGLAPHARCISPSTYGGEQGLPALPVPASFVAVCSRGGAEGPLAELDSVFLDPRDDLLERITSVRPLFAASAGVALAAGEPAERLSAAPSADVDAPVVGDLLRAVFGHDDAVPPDRDEALAQARTLVRDAFDQRERATVRLAELEAEVADQYARLSEADARDERSADTIAALRAEVDALRAQIPSLQHECEAQRAEAAASAGFAEQLRTRHDVLARERVALLAQLERLRNESAHGERPQPAGAGSAEALAAEVVRLRRAVDEFAVAQRAAAARAAGTAAFDAGNHELKASLAAALRERDEVRVQLERVLNSHSWRMTKPLRIAMRPFRDR